MTKPQRVRERAVRAYLRSRRSSKDVGREFGVTGETVCVWVHAAGGVVRGSSGRRGRRRHVPGHIYSPGDAAGHLRIALEIGEHLGAPEHMASRVRLVRDILQSAHEEQLRAMQGVGG